MISGCFILCLLGLTSLVRGNIGPVDRGYVFTAPKKLLAGETESGCLSLHNLEGPAHILLELLSPSLPNSDDEVLASTSNLLETGVETCLELAVPDHTPTTHSIARLRLKIRFDKYPEYHVNTEKEVYIEHDSVITFVETDKPVYKPGQDVRVRILALTHDLKPWKRAIPKVWIENPSEVRVAQWTNLSTDRGMVQLTFPLSPESSPGAWKIKVEKKKSLPQLIHTTTFEVRKYVLPRFQVTINSPRYILADAHNVTWTVCASYSYGKPVRGTLLLKSSPQTPSWRRKLNLPEIHNEVQLTSADGCTKFTVTGTELGLAHWQVAPTSIVLSANLTEAGTEVIETATSRTVVVHQALKLEFAPHTPKYFKLGLPYHGKFRVLRQDQTPAVGEKIQLCLRVRGKDEWVRVVVECRNFTSSVGGFVNFIVPPQHKNIVLLSFVATAIEYPTKYYSPDKRWRVFMDQPSAYIDVGAWYSPSDSYLAVARGYQPIVCGEKYPFNVMYTMPTSQNVANESLAFHYSINSKGDLLIFGHVKHKPHQDSLLNYSEFRNVLGAVEAPNNKSEHASVVHRFPLSVKVTPSMAPLSELLLYYVRNDGETVATTYTIEVGHCFENKVKTSWQTGTQMPGERAQYHVEAAPWSLCGVSVLDKSTLFLARSQLQPQGLNKGSSLLDAEKAFEKVKRFHLDADTPLYQSVWSHCEKTTQPETTIGEIDHLPSPAVEAPPVWDLERERRARRKRQSGLGASVTGGGTWVNYVDAMQAFDDFGVIVMSDLIVESRPCPQHPWMTSRESIDFRMMRRGMDEPDRMVWMAAKSMPQAFPLLYGHEMGYVDHLTDHASATLRSYFPETWLWELVPTGKDGRATIKHDLPHTITEWIGHTVCISPNYGLGIAQPVKITAFQPFFLDYTLPYSVKRGEILRMKVSLFNYMDYSLPVKITLIDAFGFDLQLPQKHGSYCIGAKSSVVHEYPLKARLIGEINVTVSAAVDPDYGESCGPEILVNTRDSIVKPILVLPEGFPIETTESAFVCPKDFADDSSIVWNLDLPKEFLVPDSARGYVSLVGDLLGPALENLENLVRLPFGCGEQNLILFTPNIHVIGYLEATRRNNPDLRRRAIRSVEKGYQRELNYRHPDGSYSAFGPQSSESGGSMWLTAFVVKSFAQARPLIHVDERDLKLSVKWIVKKQLENGCFPLVGRIFHKDMKGGLQEDSETYPSALTAYVLISLLESGVPLAPSLISNALYCLEKGMAASERDGNPYTATLSTYALALLEHPNANASMKSLLERSTRLHDLIWWEDKRKPSKGLSIEMTAYAVLSLVKLGGEANMAVALKAVRWMAKQRNAEGGFTSTQDTVLGLEALAKYAVAMSSNTTDLSILITTGEVDQVFHMNEENRMVLAQVRLPVLPTPIEIFAEGEGCVLVQANLKYNVANATGSEAFDLTLNAEPVISGGECSMQKLTICSRYKMADEETNMALLEIGMVSGYVPDKPSLHALLEESTTKVRRFEEDRGTVVIYFDKLTSERTCISFLVTRENIIDHPKPANVKLYDYYQQELVITQSYEFSRTCKTIDDDEDEKEREIEVEHNDTGDGLDEVIHPIALDKSPGEPKEGSVNETLKPQASIQRSSSKVSAPSISTRGESLSGDSTDNSPMTQLDQEALGHVEKLREIIAFEMAELDKKNIVQEGSTTRATTFNFVDTSTTSVLKLPDDDELRTSRVANVDEIVDPASSRAEFGSGEEPETRSRTTDSSSNFFGNPAFVIIDHELESPDGVEGPPPVYVKPSYNFNFPKETVGVAGNGEETFYANQTEPRTVAPVGSLGDNSSITVAQHQSTNNSTASICPVCEESSGDMTKVYCSANSLLKVAMGRKRTARVLLHVRAPHRPERLRGLFEFVLDPRCTCTPLDETGNLVVVVMRSEEGERFARHSKKISPDGTYAIYNLPRIGWSNFPQEITNARASCQSPAAA